MPLSLLCNSQSPWRNSQNRTARTERPEHRAVFHLSTGPVEQSLSNLLQGGAGDSLHLGQHGDGR
jgi:hypothetical protein